MYSVLIQVDGVAVPHLEHIEAELRDIGVPVERWCASGGLLETGAEIESLRGMSEDGFAAQIATAVRRANRFPCGVDVTVASVDDLPFAI